MTFQQVLWRFFLKLAVPSLLLSTLVAGCWMPVQALAQQTPYVVGSTVIGHVYCGDTNEPARFAKVMLKSATPSHVGEDFVKNIENIVGKASAKSGEPVKPKTEEQTAAMAKAADGMNQITEILSATTVGLDGAYRLVGVKAGTYYVHAIYPGYIDPLSGLTAADYASTDPAMRARIAQIPTVTVSGTDSARADVRLERGAAVGGRLLYDDGAPAVGWTISVVQPKVPEQPGEAAAAMMNQAMAMSGATQVFKTDDRGNYRLSGIAAGDYVVRASLIATGIGINVANMADGGSGINLAVYNGDTFSRADAKPIHLTAGEDVNGVDLNVPSRNLHSIVGHVVAKSDGHTLNIGSVSLTRKDNPALHLTAAIRDDGSFHFEYLPPANYTVTIVDAAEGTSTPSKGGGFMGISIPTQEITHKYGTDTAEVALTDQDVDTTKLTVAQTDWTPPAKKAGAAEINPGDLLKGLFSSDSDDTKKP
jgi:hypothetical protein